MANEMGRPSFSFLRDATLTTFKRPLRRIRDPKLAGRCSRPTLMVMLVSFWHLKPRCVVEFVAPALI